jgi:HlyD family secretion protein
VSRLATKQVAQAVLSKIPAVAVVLAAAGGFYLLAHGGTLSAISAHGYAEEVNHDYGPLRAGRVASVRVKLGQKVKVGDVLAAMDRRSLEARREVLQAELSQAEAQVVAEKERHAAQILRSEILVLRARANARQDRAELAELTRQLARLDGLAAEQLVRQTELEQRRQLQQRLAARAATYDEARARGQGELGGSASRGASRAVQIAARIAPYREAVEAKKAALRELELRLEDTEVRARVDGTVAAVLKWPGEVVPAGTGLVRVVTARPGFVVAWLPARQAWKVTLGRSAVLRRSRLLGASFQGQVVEIGPEVEEFPARVRVAPNTRAWGRRVVIATQATVDFLPGEELHVHL